MEIRMLCGSYGYRNGQGGIEIKDAGSGTFTVNDNEGERLVGMGYAVDMSMLPEKGSRAAEAGLVGIIELESLVSMNKKQLEQMARDMGVPVSGSKEELAERIYHAMDEGGRGKGMQGIKEEEPVD